MYFNNKIMAFNLKKYITEKYLTEKIQSDIIINKLMNDKGEMFKFYKHEDSPTYKKFVNIAEELNNILKQVFPNYLRKHIDKNNNKIVYINTEFHMDDNKIKLMHEKYMKLINDFIKIVNNMFTKPDPYLFSAIVSGINYGYQFSKYRVDIFNITDDCFDIYQYKDLKQNKAMQKKIYYEINNKIAFFISNNKIEAVSKEGNIILLPIDNEYLKSNNYTFKNVTSIQDYIRDLIKKENILNNSICMRLTNNEILEFPLISESGNYDGNYDTKIFNFINKKFNIFGYNNYLNPLISHKINVGKINSKASTLQKLTNWGNSLDDEIIIYTPSKIYQDDEHHSTINQGKDNMYTQELGYNEIKHSNHVNRRLQQRKDFYDIQNSTYKWVRDILGKYEPYAGGKQNKIWKYGNKILNQSYYTLYSNDMANDEIAHENIAKYKVMLNQAKSLKDVNIYKEQLKNILGTINTSIINGKDFILKIKNTYKEDKDKFKSLMLLYSVFNKTLSAIIARYNSIQNRIIDFNKEYNIKNIFAAKRLYDTNNDLQERIKSEINVIKSDVNNLNNFMPQLIDINDKINKILEDE